MPLVVDQLRLWTIGFKWAGLDARQVWFRIPTAVCDNFSTLLEAVLHNQLDCLTLAPEKYAGDDPELAAFHIRHWIDDVYAGVHGHHFNRKLLRHAIIERTAFQDWCERRTIPLPEFWFPPGWTEYRWPQDDFEPVPERPAASNVNVDPEVATSLDAPGPLEAGTASVEGRGFRKLKPVQLAKIVCGQIAGVIWKDEPSKTIADMSKDERILKYGGGQYYSEEVVRRWVKEVAPPEVSAKPGRPKKKNPTEGE